MTAMGTPVLDMDVQDRPAELTSEGDVKRASSVPHSCPKRPQTASEAPRMATRVELPLGQ
jgi:hypothetical protein